MRIMLTVLSLCILHIPARADPMISLPPTLTAQPGRLLRITAEAPDAKLVRWIVTGEADLIPLNESGKSAIFSAATSGTYKIVAYTAKGDIPSEPAVCVVTVGNPTPPAPPTPPTPTPPTDPLAAELRALLAADSSPEKGKHVEALCELYRQAQVTADDPAVGTAGALAEILKRSSAALVPSTALIGVRKRVSEVLGESLPSNPAERLTAESRTRAKAAFARAQKALCEVTK
ncbi:hypothetical protein [Tuwongella immobilis]|uniref:Ig-like domain-containing protein n=1 Tax=Tuwongella immobilis TaxID=692036 RepID=A0A6C2YVQ7_9BACT|nr:hypothetical protein [Tuwongella immobilis]VIP05596.1 unnamed protein product [Tuwongella immobilis]VTS08547.1 unnamed protein product [Tuwongella immobilis]